MSYGIKLVLRTNKLVCIKNKHLPANCYKMLLNKICTCCSVIELFSWLLEITEDDTESYEGARVVWSIKFEPHTEETEEVHRTEGRKSTIRFDVQKDDIQAVVPISKVCKCLF